jgi:hypothetical protein
MLAKGSSSPLAAENLKYKLVVTSGKTRFGELCLERWTETP